MFLETAEKEHFVSNELLYALRKTHKDVKDAWYEADEKREYVYVEFTYGQIRRVDVTGGGVASILLDVTLALCEQ